jgi:hypothetical protein
VYGRAPASPVRCHRGWWVALRIFVWAVSIGDLGQSVEELLDGGGHGETGGSDADAGPAAVADDGNASVGHAFDQVAGEIAVAAVPDPSS